jgi:hypothetical protein
MDDTMHECVYSVTDLRKAVTRMRKRMGITVRKGTEHPPVYVNSNGPGAPSIRVDFDDGTDGVRVSFLSTSPNYVETDMYEAI